MSYESFLHRVTKPARYLSLEKNSIIKDASSVHLRFALCFPEVYEIGSAHLGLKILYHLLNRVPEISAERCFAPWVDMESELRERGQSLLSLETASPLADFDFLGFSLQSELTFTNLLNMLDLSKLELLSRDRKEGDPIILAGGPVTSNPEPCADFIDVFLVGDGEDAVLELAEVVIKAKSQGQDREKILRQIAKIPGFYVPCFYEETFSSDGCYQGLRAMVEDIPKQIERRYVKELKPEFYPPAPVIPHMASVQDRHVVEVVRGCTQGCRFCQAGYIYRPIRELSKGDILDLSKSGLEDSGYEELGLVSLSTADYSDFSSMVEEVASMTTPQGVSISLPSLRADRVSVEAADSVSQVKHSGFTFAPEAGSVRLRRLINKNISNEELMHSIALAFEKGWTVIKLYFMVGLPTESYEDLEETVDLIKKIESIAKQKGSRAKLHISFGVFVPKAHTPFQWEGFPQVQELENRLRFLRVRVASKRVRFKWQDPRIAHFEALVSKGDRSVGKGLLQAFREGHRFEGWSEHFHYDSMMASFKKAGVDLQTWAAEKSLDQALPWDHIDSKIKKKFLIFERKKAFREEQITTTDCRFGDCHHCGVPGSGEDIKLKHWPPDENLKKQVLARKKPPSQLQEGQTRTNSLRYRAVFTKKGQARFLARQDVQRAFQMGIRVSRFPVLFSKGFSPRPVFQFGPALPLGVESNSEVLDIWMIEPVSAQQFLKINSYLPRGIEVYEFSITDSSQESLSVLYPLARYSAKTGPYKDRILQALERWHGQDSFLVEHRKRVIDLKAAIRKLELDQDRLILEVSVTSQEGVNANPFLVMEKVLGLNQDQVAKIRLLKEANL
jgi:radical SAM family uncharacterized protein/radical SAM-linked protein